MSRARRDADTLHPTPQIEQASVKIGAAGKAFCLYFEHLPTEASDYFTVPDGADADGHVNSTRRRDTRKVSDGSELAKWSNALGTVRAALRSIEYQLMGVTAPASHCQSDAR